MVPGRALVATAVLGAAAIACSSGGGGPDVSRVEATGVVPDEGPLGVMDAGLVGFGDRGGDVVVSHDRGRTWNAAELSDRPANLQLSTSSHALYADDDVDAVVGRDAE